MMNNPVIPNIEQDKFSSEIGNEVSPSMPDEELVHIINSDINNTKQDFDRLLKIKDLNQKYYLGKQKLHSQAYEDDRPIVNRVFGSIETKTAIITAETPDPWVKVFPKTKAGRRMENKLSRKLQDLWEFDVNMQQIMEKNLRNYYMGRVSFLKYGFDSKTKKPWTSVVDLDSVRFDLEARGRSEYTFFAHFVKKPITEWIRMFPEKKTELLRAVGRSQTDANSRSRLTVTEYYTYYFEGEERKLMVVWKYKDVILGKEINPHWKSKSHYSEPLIPFIPLTSISTGLSTVDDTSEIEQAIPLQDAINKRKAQIDRNAEMANGIFVATENAMDKETFDSIGPDTRKIFLNGDVQSPEQGFSVQNGRSLDFNIFSDMQDSKGELDNIMATHDTTRGESSRSETFKGQALRREADLGRLDLTVRAYEQVAEDWYNAMVQLMHVYDFDEVPILTEEEDTTPEEEFARLSGMVPVDERSDVIKRDEIKKFRVKVIVKKGTTIPVNPAVLREDAMTLRQTGSIDTQTFIDMYNGRIPRDSRRVAKRVFMEQNMPEKLYPELFGEDGGIDYEQIEHIENILRTTGEEREIAIRTTVSQVKNPAMMDEEELQMLETHIKTLQSYMAGAEVDENLPAFNELDNDSKQALKEHLAIETGILNVQNQQLLEMQGQMGMEEGMEEPMMEEPMGEQMPEMGVEGQMPTVPLQI